MDFKPLGETETVRECALKMLEEASEACEAVKLLSKASLKGSGKDYERARREAFEEVADLAQTITDVLSVCGCTSLEWVGAAYAVRRRNLQRGRKELRDSGSLGVTWHGAGE